MAKSGEVEIEQPDNGSKSSISGAKNEADREENGYK
jgi:hypothetical protein